MKAFLKNIVKELSGLSENLDKKSIFVDKPWALIDSDLEIQKLIFKKNKELIMSKDGHVSMGTWEYLPGAKSLLIDRGKDKILCNEGFIADAIMVLKMDGTNEDFFVLANENIIPDLDVYNYLKNLRNRHLNIAPLQLVNGKTIEIAIENSYSPEIGNNVTIDGDAAIDGMYKVKKTDITYIVKDSVITSIIYEVFTRQKMVST